MLKADSTLFPSLQVGRYPAHAPGATPKPKLLYPLRGVPHSRHYCAANLFRGRPDELTGCEIAKADLPCRSGTRRCRDFDLYMHR